MNSFLTPEIWPYIKNAHGDESQRVELAEGLVISYNAKLNMFTFLKGRFAIHLPIRVVGVPPSLSVPGYHTDSDKGIKEIAAWVSSQKGHTLMLNADYRFEGHFAKLQTLPSVVMENTFSSFEDYLAKLRSHYRYRFMKARRRFESVTISENHPFDASLYALYEAVYQRSAYPLVKNTPEFFSRFPGTITAFHVMDKPIGFCQYHIADGVLTFMFCGLDYEVLKSYDTYLNLLLYLVECGIKAGVKTIDLGQTTEEIKLKLGGSLKPLNLYYHHHHPLMNALAKRILPFLSYRPTHPDYHVFKS